MTKESGVRGMWERAVHFVRVEVGARRHVARYRHATGGDLHLDQRVAGDLRLLERHACTVLYMAERGHLSFDGKGEAAEPLKHLVAKLTNETLSFVACIRAASILGAYHHLRALYELAAATHYLFGEPGEVVLRVRRFREWPMADAYQRRLRLEGKLKRKEIEKSLYDDLVRTLDAKLAPVTEAQRADWNALYACGFDKGAVKNWHVPKKHSDLLRAVDATGTDVEMFELASAAVHVTPAGNRLASRTSVMLIGSDRPKVERVVEAALALFWRISFDLAEQVDGRLWTQLSPDADAWQQARGRSTQRGAGSTSTESGER